MSTSYRGLFNFGLCSILLLLLGVGCSVQDTKPEEELIKVQKEQIDLLNKKIEDLQTETTSTVQVSESSITSTISDIPDPVERVDQKIISKPVIKQPTSTLSTESKVEVPVEKVVEVKPVEDVKPKSVSLIKGDSVATIVPSDLYTYEDAQKQYYAARDQFIDGNMEASEYSKVMTNIESAYKTLEFCRANYGTQSYADVKKRICLCNSGFVMDDLQGKCVTYEQYCRNTHGAEATYKDYACYYCPVGYKLQRDSSNLQCIEDLS